MVLYITGHLRLDAATLLFATGLSALSLSLLCALLARGEAFKRLGLREWAASLALASWAFLLFFLRETGTGALSYLLANVAALAVVPLGMRAYAKLLKVELSLSSMAISSAVGLSGVLAVSVGGQDPQLGIFSVSMAIGFQLVQAVLLVAAAPGRHGAPWRAVLNTMHAVSALAFLVRAGMALNGNAVVLTTQVNSWAQVMVLCVAVLYFMVTTVAFIVMLSQRQQHEMSEHLRRDGLTGLYTRTAFFEMADAKPCRWQADGYALVLMDIDHFKRINDSFGHAGGDLVLAHAARMLSQLTRLTDMVVRYGGDEFCVLLQACSAADAGRFAQRLVDEARRQSVRLKDGRNVRFTFSVGYACAPAGHSRHGIESLAAVIDQADRALYVAKSAGRNRMHSSGAMPAAEDVAVTA